MVDKIPLKALWDELEKINPEEDQVGQIATWSLDEKTNDLVIQVWAPDSYGGHLSLGTEELTRLPSTGDGSEGPAYEAAMVRYVFALTGYEPSEQFRRDYYPRSVNGQQMPPELAEIIAERVRQMEEDDTISLVEAATAYDDATAQIDMDNADTEHLSNEQIQEAVDRAIESIRQQGEDEGGGG